MSAQINKTAIFIDGANLYKSAKSLGLEIDFKRLLTEFQSRGKSLRALYYTTVLEDQQSPSIRPLCIGANFYGLQTLPCDPAGSR